MGKLKSAGKPFEISKWEVWEAYRGVKKNKGAPGVDGVTLEEFETDLQNNLYRPRKSALAAVERCRRRCWEKDWVIDLDIAKFFDSVRWDLIVKAVEAHTEARWVLLYVKRRCWRWSSRTSAGIRCRRCGGRRIRPASWRPS
jgi:retron-type reverse transcriptase